MCQALFGPLLFARRVAQGPLKRVRRSPPALSRDQPPVAQHGYCQHQQEEEGEALQARSWRKGTITAGHSSSMHGFAPLRDPAVHRNMADLHAAGSYKYVLLCCSSSPMACSTQSSTSFSHGSWQSTATLAWRSASRRCGQKSSFVPPARRTSSVSRSLPTCLQDHVHTTLEACACAGVKLAPSLDVCQKLLGAGTPSGR